MRIFSSKQLTEIKTGERNLDKIKTKQKGGAKKKRGKYRSAKRRHITSSGVSRLPTGTVDRAVLYSDHMELHVRLRRCFI